MYHSITFTRLGISKNTWDDWHLIPTSRPVFSSPEPKERYLDVPGSSNTIDLCEAVKKYPVYKNREGTIEFLVDNGHSMSWSDLYFQIVSFLNGRQVEATLEDDLYHYYVGRFFVKSWKSDKHWSFLTLGYILKPYKLRVTSSIEDWLWDPFNFDIGVIQETFFVDRRVNGALFMNLSTKWLIGRMPVSPVFHTELDNASEEIRVLFTNDELGQRVELYLHNGHQSDDRIVFSNLSGSNGIMLRLYGHGTVSIDFRSGGL